MKNSRESGRRSESYRSDSSEEWGRKGPREIDYGCLSSGMAVGTSVGITRGVMMMKQASEKSEYNDCNNGNSLGWEQPSDARSWILDSHLVIQRVHRLRIGQSS
jgi:hypothetical protein